MGNQICKGAPIEQIQKTDSNNLKLSNKILQYLSQKKPFQQQISSSQKSTKQLNSGIYIGSLNLMSNPSGYGKLYKKDGSLYIGQFRNGQAHGQGAYILSDGTYFQGEFTNNNISRGVYHTQGFTYNGEFKNNLFDGKGNQDNSNERYQFQGVFKQGKKVSGVMKWQKDNIKYAYQGQLKDNGQFINGAKLIEYPVGFYVGEYKNNQKHGKGTYSYQNGLKYIGQYVNGHKQGYGVLYNGDQTISYEGQFKNGLPHGKGKALNKQKKSMIQSTWIQGIDQQIINQ